MISISFINGFISGAGASLAVVAAILLTIYGEIEGIRGFSALEIRIAILLGAIVFAASIGYEYYLKDKKDTPVTSL